MARDRPRPNDRCPCGSGKKYKHCCRGKNPREVAVYVGFDSPTVNRVQREPDGHLSFYQDDQLVTPIASFVEMAYQGKSRKKVITRASLSETPKVANPSLLLCDYDLVCVVDTNTKVIHGSNRSIGCVAVWECRLDGTALRCLPVSNSLFRLRDGCDSPERRGWVAAMKFVVEYQPHPPHPSAKVGMVVDAHMDSLARIARREEPVHGTTMLPTNFHMIYATADKGDTVQNRLLQLCDEAASQALAKLEEEAGIAAST